ncbi:hypothetical protein Mapa_002750 [Marchantia paleacea]|nr:hypothetical protein Mapa_002750 [Marchantia paleacea]
MRYISATTMLTFSTSVILAAIALEHSSSAVAASLDISAADMPLQYEQSQLEVESGKINEMLSRSGRFLLWSRVRAPPPPCTPQTCKCGGVVCNFCKTCTCTENRTQCTCTCS